MGFLRGRSDANYCYGSELGHLRRGGEICQETSHSQIPDHTLKGNKITVRATKLSFPNVDIMTILIFIHQ